MANVSIELDFDKLLAAIQRLPRAYKVRIWQALDAELNRDEINREFAKALEEIWDANQGVNEDEVMADVLQAIREFRAEEAARRP